MGKLRHREVKQLADVHITKVVAKLESELKHSGSEIGAHYTDSPREDKPVNLQLKYGIKNIDCKRSQTR